MSAVFSLVYDGDAVAPGSIDARDLAPALLAFADLIDEAAPLVSPPLPSLSVRVNPDFKRGSFEVVLGVSGVVGRLLSLFTSQEVDAISNLFQILGISAIPGAHGFFQLIRRARGRKPTSVSVTTSTTTTVTFEGDLPVEVQTAALRLLDNPRARGAAETITRPLTRDGYDEMVIRHGGQESFRLGRDEVEYFAAPVDRDQQRVTDANVWVKIVTLSFEPKLKWRVSDGQRKFYVTILDEDFIRRVLDGRAQFKAGDTLLVTMRTTQWMDAGELKSDYAITAVLQQGDSIPSQLSLP